MPLPMDVLGLKSWVLKWARPENVFSYFKHPHIRGIYVVVIGRDVWYFYEARGFEPKYLGNLSNPTFEVEAGERISWFDLPQTIQNGIKTLMSPESY